jgi:D-amino-acid oxidase
MGTKVIVVGAGVSGLSCAHELLRAGLHVEVWARDEPGNTTSVVAAAFWYPYRVDPPDRVNPWARRSYERFAELTEISPSGVRMREAIELFVDPVPSAPWGEGLLDFRRASPFELPPGRRDGFLFKAPVIETPIYVPWLATQVRNRGGTFRPRVLTDLGPALDAADIVVNASGLGARELVGDRDLYPVRGQVVSIAQPGIARVTIDEHGPGGIAYIVPRSGDVVLGGTADEGVEELGTDPATSAGIRARCAKLDPRIESAEVVGAKVGLRPCRSEVRLELEPLDDGRCIVHDYGHGGAGVTLSWGCAEEVAKLVQDRASSHG